MKWELCLHQASLENELFFYKLRWSYLFRNKAKSLDKVTTWTVFHQTSLSENIIFNNDEWIKVRLTACKKEIIYKNLFFCLNIGSISKSDLKLIICSTLEQLYAPPNKELVVRCLPPSPAITASKFHHGPYSHPFPSPLWTCCFALRPGSPRATTYETSDTGQQVNLLAPNPSDPNIYLAILYIFHLWWFFFLYVVIPASICLPFSLPPFFPLNPIMGPYEWIEGFMWGCFCQGGEGSEGLKAADWERQRAKWASQ